MIHGKLPHTHDSWKDSNISPSVIESEQHRRKIRTSFTKTEDELLRNLVNKYGDYDWNTIAGLIPGKSPRQCRDRFRNYLSPELVNSVWTKEEDKELIMQYSIHGPKWALLVQYFPKRSTANIKNRFATLFRSTAKKVQMIVRKNELIQKIDESVRNSIPSSLNTTQDKAKDVNEINAEELMSDGYNSINQMTDYDPFDMNVFDI